MYFALCLPFQSETRQIFFSFTRCKCVAMVALIIQPSSALAAIAPPLCFLWPRRACGIFARKIRPWSYLLQPTQYKVNPLKLVLTWTEVCLNYFSLRIYYKETCFRKINKYEVANENIFLLLLYFYLSYINITNWFVFLTIL